MNEDEWVLTRSNVLTELRTLNRPGKNNLIKFLKESDYFTAPASTKYHLSEKGGLMKHSWNVYQVLKHKNNEYGLGYDKDTIQITGLLHDACKINFYQPNYNNYKVKDKLPIGHGEKSVIILQQHIQLTTDEILAIRWHMNAFDTSALGSNKYSFNNAVNQCPLVTALFTADYESTKIVETGHPLKNP